jgi:outer membrane immunogenic protein
MRKLSLLSAVVTAVLGFGGATQAADMPVKAPPAPVVVPFTWTGFYVGGNIGAAWGHRDWTDVTRGLALSQTSDARFIGGGQAGFNYQFSNFVIGVEGDIDWIARDKTSPSVLVPAVGTIAVNSTIPWIATAAARFGIAVDHWLLYGKAGGGWVGNNNFTVSNITTGTSIVAANTREASGFLGGIGIEYAITNNWTVKAEYDYLSLSRRSFIVPAGSPFFVGDTFTGSGRSIQMAKIGFNYLFSTGAPVAARY